MFVELPPRGFSNYTYSKILGASWRNLINNFKVTLFESIYEELSCRDLLWVLSLLLVGSLATLAGAFTILGTLVESRLHVDAKPLATLGESCRYPRKCSSSSGRSSDKLDKYDRFDPRTPIVLRALTASTGSSCHFVATLGILDRSSESGGNLGDLTKSSRCSLVEGSGTSCYTLSES